MLVPRLGYHDANPVKSLTDFANDVDEEYDVTSYTRYWHGYLVILKPLLLFFDMADIRMMNMIVQFILVSAVFLEMDRRGYRAYLPAFGTAILLLNPVAIALSLQFSTVYYLSLFSLLHVLRKEKNGERINQNYFFLLGSMTAYFDFLTYPMVGLCFPLMLIIVKENEWKKAVKRVVISAFFWGTGYLGMWCGKWAIGSIILKYNLWKDVLLRTQMYKSMRVDDIEIGSWDVIFKNIRVLIKWPILLLAICLLLYCARKIRNSRLQIQVSSLRTLMPYGMIAIAPFLWYFLAGTHSYEHYWFTYRDLSVSVLAFLAGIIRMSEVDR